MYVFPYELLSNTQLFKILMGLHVSKDCISTIKGETRGKHDSEFLLNNLYAHRGIFSPLIASAVYFANCLHFFCLRISEAKINKNKYKSIYKGPFSFKEQFLLDISHCEMSSKPKVHQY